jgi:hypothetical protein
MTPETAAAIIKRRLHGRLVKKAYNNYTGYGYVLINMAAGARPVTSTKNLRTAKGRFEAMKRHARKFPRTVPTLYRGMAATNPKAISMLANFTHRRNHHYPSFLSFSTSKNVAARFTNGNGYILSIERGTYPSIRSNTYTRAANRNEKEVTLAPGTYTMIRKTNNGFHVKYTPNRPLNRAR